MKLLFTFAALLFTTMTTLAENKKQRIENYNIQDGIAIKGYDPVSYFSNEPSKGNKKYSYTHKGISYQFANENNLNTFKANPSKYEPQYGGWCAYAFAIGKEKVNINPKSYKIVDKKLYLFFNSFPVNTLKKWNKKDDASQIKTADAVWNTIIN